jgi:hypothetical protein
VPAGRAPHAATTAAAAYSWARQTDDLSRLTAVGALGTFVLRQERTLGIAMLASEEQVEVLRVMATPATDLEWARYIPACVDTTFNMGTFLSTHPRAPRHHPPGHGPPPPSPSRSRPPA